MKTLAFALVALAAVACAGASEPAYTLADTYGVPDACTVRTTDPELLLLRCSPHAELTEECAGGSSVEAELWTRPGADATPYGVTGRLELTCHE